VARPKSKGAYTPLAAQYYLDDAILEAGPEAELLFVRCLSFLASIPTDGFITERQMKVVGVGLRNMPRRVETLLGVGLLEASPGGFVARSWLKWNKSADEIGKLLARDRERKSSKPAEEGTNSDLIPSGFQTDSSYQSSTEQYSTEQSTKDKDIPAPAALESEFSEAWNCWPKKVERKQALARFKVAAKKRGATELKNDIVLFGAAYSSTTEKKFVPALGAWLNGERWTDELPTSTNPAAKVVHLIDKYKDEENAEIGNSNTAGVRGWDRGAVNS